MSKNEIELNKNNKFVTRYGTTLEDKHPSVIYLRTKSKITPLIKKKEYDNDVYKIKEGFSSFVKDSVNKCKSVNNDYLFNIDISSKSVRFGKVSFLRYDVYLKPIKQKTIEENLYRIQQFSTKLDKKLEKLLNLHDIICK